MAIVADKNLLERLYREKIYRSDRLDNAEEVALTCQEILHGDVSLEVRAATYVVLVYKSIEISNRSIVSKFLGDGLISDLKERALDQGASELGVREDPVQLYISVLTSQWHLMIFWGGDPTPYLNELIIFSSKISRVKHSYALNIGNAYLLYAYSLFLKNDIPGCKRLISEAYGIFVSIVCDQRNDRLPTSSHFGDLMKMTRALQSLLAGNEWMQGGRKRVSLWSKDKIIKYVSRVDVDKCVDFRERFITYFEGVEKS